MRHAAAFFSCEEKIFATGCIFLFSYYFLIKILILIRKASPNGAACFVIYKERNHKTSLI